MRIRTLASSSSGNCTIVSQGDTHILIDAGISMRRIKTALKELDLTPEELDGIIVTHEHSDHIGGLKMMHKYYSTRIFAPKIVGGDVINLIPELADTTTLFEAGSEICVGDLVIKSFRTLHDTPESVGYRITGGGRSMVYATDLGCVTREVERAALGADFAIVEANHDVAMLRSGPYPYHLVQRILSDHGHLSNEAGACFAAQLAEAGARNIVLAHLSKENNTPRRAREAAVAALERMGAVETQLAVAPADTAGEVYII